MRPPGGCTDPDNLILLCRAHHWAVHEGGFRIQGRAPGTLTFIRPDGRILPASALPASLKGDPVETLKACHQGMKLAITAETSACNWDGGPMDYDIALMGIMGPDREDEVAHERCQGKGEGAECRQSAPSRG